MPETVSLIPTSVATLAISLNTANGGFLQSAISVVKEVMYSEIVPIRFPAMCVP